MDNKQANNISFRVFPTPEEVIEANNFEQISYLKSFDSTTIMESSSISSTSFSSSSSLSSSSDLMEDATSSSSSSSSNGPLFQLSDLMDKLPIKRGLSKYYEGKSESFTSLASVENLEDLAKRANPYKKKIKLCRNYFSSPKSSISKKSSSSSYSSRTSSSSLLVSRNCSNNFKANCRPPTIPPVQKDF